MQMMEGGLPDNHSYLLLGSPEEGGYLVIVDDAASLKEAKEKAQDYLDEHAEGGVLIVKHVAACYRLPVFPEIQH